MADLSTGSAFVAGTTIVASAMNTRFTSVETWAKGTPDLSTSGSMTTIKGTLNVDEAVTLDATLAVTGTATLAGIVDVTNTTDASDATGNTGALKTEGGASIAKKLYVGTETNLTERVFCQSTDDVDLDAVSGALIVGNADGSGQHVAIDGNEIQSKSNATTAADLFLNPLGAQVILYDGSVSAPSLKFANNDADTGFYRVSNQQIGLSANGIAAAWSITAGSDAGLAVGAWSAVVGGTDKDIYRNATYGTLFYSSSKRALKENIQSISNIGSVVDALNPVTFIAAATGEETSGEKAWRENDLIYGFVAEEVAGIADGKLATYDVDGETLVPSNWKTRDMVALLAAELKSVRQRLAALEA